MRVGLFGGSFDPIHNAHLKLASAALSQLKLDRVYFILSPRSPFKIGKSQTPSAVRLRMLRLALKGKKKFMVATWEMKRKGASYTVDTLRWYKRRHPQHELFLILGSDALTSFGKWKNPLMIRKMATVVVGRRPGSRHPHLRQGYGGQTGLPALALTKAGVTVCLKGTFPDISSTDIRNKLSRGASVAGRIPSMVLKYITKRNSHYHARHV